MDGTFAICGTLVHATESNPMVILKNHCMGVREGKIVFVDQKAKLQENLQSHCIPESSVKHLKQWQFVMPGMIDTHIHAPQYPNAGKGLDRGLLEWLNKYTFPTEAKFKADDYATEVYNKVVLRTLKNGTTTACYFATIHHGASMILCDALEKHGQRAFVGKVNMDQNSPDFYVEDTKDSIQDTKRFVEELRSRKNHRIQPIITPRFAVSCSAELMKELSKVASDNNVHIQTHISETRPECAWIKELFPDNVDYLDVYDSCGLITDKTVLAHGIYLSDRELQVIKDKGAAISHCPNSNLSIRSGLLDVQRVLSKGIKIGLGTDVSGGYSPSILDAIRTSLNVTNVLAIQTDSYKPISYKEAFMMATLGGSKALSLDHIIGNFMVGKEFDALLIDLKAKDSQIDVFEDDTTEDCIEKFLYTGDSRNIVEVYVGGQKVSEITG